MIGNLGVNIVGLVLAFALNVTLARILGSRGLGQYAFVFSVVTFLLPLAVLGLPQFLTREVSATAATGRWDVVRGLMVRPRQIVTLAVLGISLIWLGAVVVLDLGSPGRTEIYIFGCATLFCIAQDSVTSSQMKGLGEVAQSSIAHAVVRPGLFTAFLLLASILFAGIDAATAMLLHALASALAASVGFVLLLSLLRKRVDRVRATYHSREWLRGSFPFLLLEGLRVAGPQIPIIALGLLQPVEEVGWLRVALSLSALTPFVHGIMATVAQPEFARLHAVGDNAGLQDLTTRIIRVAVAATVPIVVVFVAAGGPLLRALYGDDYAASYVPLVVLVFAELVSVIFGPVEVLLAMTHNERFALQALGLSGVMAIVMSLILIPSFGAVGAALASATALITWNAVMAFRVSTSLRLSVISWTRPDDHTS